MNRIDSSWGWRLPVKFRDGHGAQREAADRPSSSPHETPVPISRRLAIYRISQLNETEIKIGGTE